MKHLPPLLVAAAVFCGMATLPLTAAAVESNGRVDNVPLSDAVKAHIAAMTPVFDGKSLEGWIQYPPAPQRFDGADILDLPGFEQRLLHPGDPVSSFLAAQLDGATRSVLSSVASDAAAVKKHRSAVVKLLNAVVSGPSIYDSARFAAVTFRRETDALRSAGNANAARLNRMLLEDAYPGELARSPLASWVVKDGAMASTGAGRGVVCTASDYTRYRLIFLMRHVSGRPDHQPCVLIFCERPGPGEMGRDALGGIQFQVPNGGHWDYRPGRNNGGTGFTNPTKTHFDNHEWCQVEMLVDAKTGTARMAVAPHPGVRGVENLDFHDPAAGRAGPIAWQMHNAGLFDEYKDVRIEIDPVEDRLITAQ